MPGYDFTFTYIKIVNKSFIYDFKNDKVIYNQIEI